MKIGTEKINTEYDCVYGAGYSRDGSTLYIDRRIPEKAKIDGVEVNIWRMVAIHELVEESLEHSFDFHYHESHKMAIGAEKVALGLLYPTVTWSSYNDWWKPILKICYGSFSRLPPDLDWEPLVDSKDIQGIRRVNQLKPGTIAVPVGKRYEK